MLSSTNAQTTLLDGALNSAVVGKAIGVGDGEASRAPLARPGWDSGPAPRAINKIPTDAADKAITATTAIAGAGLLDGFP